jgi:hypothetical protein
MSSERGVMPDRRGLIWPVFLLVSLVVAAPALARQGSAPALDRLSTDVMPTRQAVELTVDPDQTGYQGRVVIDLNVDKPTR